MQVKSTVLRPTPSSRPPDCACTEHLLFSPTPPPPLLVSTPLSTSPQPMGILRGPKLCRNILLLKEYTDRVCFAAWMTAGANSLLLLLSGWCSCCCEWWVNVVVSWRRVWEVVTWMVTSCCYTEECLGVGLFSVSRLGRFGLCSRAPLSIYRRSRLSPQLFLHPPFLPPGPLPPPDLPQVCSPYTHSLPPSSSPSQNRLSSLFGVTHLLPNRLNTPLKLPFSWTCSVRHLNW